MSEDICPTCGQHYNKITYVPGEYIEFRDPNGTFFGFVGRVLPSYYEVLSPQPNVIVPIGDKSMICHPHGDPMKVVWVNKTTMKSEKVMDINGNMLPVKERKLS